MKPHKAPIEWPKCPPAGDIMRVIVSAQLDSVLKHRFVQGRITNFLDRLTDRERERERERDTDRQTDRKTNRLSDQLYVCLS